MNSHEPVLTAATIGGIVSALLALLIAFGVGITDVQVRAILTFVFVLAPVILSAFYARGKVSPTVGRRNPNIRR